VASEKPAAIEMTFAAALDPNQEYCLHAGNIISNAVVVQINSAFEPIKKSLSTREGLSSD
jgi:hypothetical protein